MNDCWHTAVHEAGHAVIGRVLGVTSGLATIAAEHPLTDDPWILVGEWEQRGRSRKIETVFHAQTMSHLAGAEATAALIGCCGREDLADGGVDERLKRATRTLVRRHIGKIDALARALWLRETITADAEIRAAAGLDTAPAEFDWATMGFGTAMDGGSIGRVA